MYLLNQFCKMSLPAVTHLDVNNSKSSSQYTTKVIWWRVLYFLSMHLCGLYYLFCVCTLQAKWRTFMFQLMLVPVINLGVAAGVHRLWSHRSYKAQWPLRLFLVLLQTMAVAKSILFWVRVHRLHHKYTDTDADPLNANRGLFFSHIGWILVEEHPEVKLKAKSMDLTDITSDPMVVLQRRFYVPITFFLAGFLPTVVPVYFWDENLWMAWLSVNFKCMAVLNSTFLLNSISHKWGAKPFDSTISPTNNWMINFISMGEGAHNYHHVFPWDYRSAPGIKNTFNPASRFIEMCAYLGLAYDLKCPSDSLVQRRMCRTGDKNWIWGWGDADIQEEDAKNTKISNPDKKL